MPLKILIGNLAPKATEDDLRKLMETACPQAVPQITIDHQTWSAPPPHEVTLSRGFAFLNVQTDDESVITQICAALNGAGLPSGRKITARPQGAPKKAPPAKSINRPELLAGMNKLKQLDKLLADPQSEISNQKNQKS